MSETAAEIRARLDRFEKAIVIADRFDDRAFAGQLRADCLQLRARLAHDEEQP